MFLWSKSRNGVHDTWYWYPKDFDGAAKCIIYHGTWSSTQRLLLSKSWCELVCNTRRDWYCISFFSSVVWVIDWTMTFDRHSRVIQHDFRFVTWFVSCQGTSHRTHADQSNSNCCSLVWSMTDAEFYLFVCVTVDRIYLDRRVKMFSSDWLAHWLTTVQAGCLICHVLYVWRDQTSTNGFFAFSAVLQYCWIVCNEKARFQVTNPNWGHLVLCIINLDSLCFQLISDMNVFYDGQHL
jgi:hypothetical protein